MAYPPINWQNDPNTTTPLSADNLNHADTQYTEATNSISSELFSPFVLSGLVATKDGTNANHLDLTAGVIYLKQSADNTLRRFSVSSGVFTTSTANATYFLDIYSVAGTTTAAPSYAWSFATTHTAQPNYMTIASVTTDASGNILTVQSDPVVSRGAVVEATPRVAMSSGGLLALVYALPTGGAGDIPGAFVGSSIVGPVDWTSFTIGGVSTNYYMRICGMVKALYSETYTFYVTTDDGARLYIGDQELVGESAWKAQSATTYSGSISLTANMWYPIVLEHFQSSSTEQLKLEWQSTTQARQDIPAANMMWQWPRDHTAVVSRYGWFHYGLKVAGNTVWHAGNDGSGSGLDADLIDGRQIFVQLATPTGANEGDIWIRGNRLNPFAKLPGGGHYQSSAGLLQTLSPVYKLSNGWDGSDQDAW